MPHGGHDALDADAQEGLLADRHNPLLDLPATTDLVTPQDFEYIQLQKRAPPTSLDLLESAGSSSVATGRGRRDKAYLRSFRI